MTIQAISDNRARRQATVFDRTRAKKRAGASAIPYGRTPSDDNGRSTIAGFLALGSGRAAPARRRLSFQKRIARALEAAIIAFLRRR
jgi:hypothetical protein